MRVLVCGGRDFDDWPLVCKTLNYLSPPPSVIIHGCARGADALAERWTRKLRIPVERFPADWEKHGRAAGPIRNKQMLDEGKPDLVVAFPGGRGTANMVRQAREAGIRVIEV